MISKFLKLFGVGMAGSKVTKSHAPYKEEAVNFMYNLLFCDDPSLFNKAHDGASTYWEEALFSKPNEKDIRALAENPQEESRVRLLAFNWLRKNQLPLAKGALLGVIIEVPLEHGLDTLAAYADGRVRYINQTGKLSIVELGVAVDIERLAKELIDTSIPVVQNIGPWEENRLPPPVQGNIRMTFLVSDGLYFGEGPLAAMQNEPMAAPIILKAVELLQAVVNTTLEQHG